jgi:hypothetical protein
MLVRVERAPDLMAPSEGYVHICDYFQRSVAFEQTRDPGMAERMRPLSSLRSHAGHFEALWTTGATLRNRASNVRIDLGDRDGGQLFLTATLSEPLEKTPRSSTSDRSSLLGQAAQVSQPRVFVNEFFAKALLLAPGDRCQGPVCLRAQERIARRHTRSACQKVNLIPARKNRPNTS